MAYFVRVVHRQDGHFTVSEGDGSGQAVPRDVIECTEQQRRAMGDVTAALLGDGLEVDAALRVAVRRLFMALICHRVGSEPFRSPVLSFCAMLGQKHYA